MHLIKNNNCLICFKSQNEDNSLKSLLTFNQVICDKCQSKFKIFNKKEIIDGVEVWFLYEYNQVIKELIYKYKGCYDLALKDVFLNKYKKEIHKKYKNYIIIYPPSNRKDDEKREFRHIEKMIECLRLKHINLFYKTKDYKQSSHHFNERNIIKDIIAIKPHMTLDTDKKYLIIDDIYTSGSTLKTIIELLVKCNIKKSNLKAVIFCKTAKFVEI